MGADIVVFINNKLVSRWERRLYVSGICWIWSFIGCTKMEQLISKSSPYFYPLSLGFTALVLIFSVVFTYKKLQNNRHPEPRSERPAKTQQQQKMDCDSTNNEDNTGGKTQTLSLSL